MQQHLESALYDVLVVSASMLTDQDATTPGICSLWCIVSLSFNCVLYSVWGLSMKCLSPGLGWTNGAGGSYICSIQESGVHWSISDYCFGYKERVEGLNKELKKQGEIMPLNITRALQLFSLYFSQLPGKKNEKKNFCVDTCFCIHFSLWAIAPIVQSLENNWIFSNSPSTVIQVYVILWKKKTIQKS